MAITGDGSINPSRCTGSVPHIHRRRGTVVADSVDHLEHERGNSAGTMQGNGHVVAMAPPGSPDAATGDVIYIAEVSPRER